MVVSFYCDIDSLGCNESLKLSGFQAISKYFDIVLRAMKKNISKNEILT
jgi:hypothetical protein